MTSTKPCFPSRSLMALMWHLRGDIYQFRQGDHLRPTVVQNSSIIRKVSSWSTPSLPWLRYQESPVDLELLKKQEAIKRKWSQLQNSLHVVVRKYFQDDAFPKEFSIQSCKQLWSVSESSPSGLPSNTSPSSNPSRIIPKARKQLSSEAQTLLLLNGFETVPLPKSKDVLDLAEGVIIKPAPPKEFKQCLLFSQTVPKTDGTTDQSKKPHKEVTGNNREYPIFVHENFTLYRILENQAAVFLDHQYNTFRKFVEFYIDGPSKRLAARIENSRLSHVFLGNPPKTEENKAWIESSNQEQQEEHAVEVIRHLNSPSTTGKEAEPLENLLVMSYENDETVLYHHMTPSVRITSLPHIMGHSSASTLVQVSLVIFGALPLAYRSYNFAVNYPGLSQTIAASVALTISYGIWSYRVASQTNQSLVISNALLHRVYARDDAVVYALQEGAVRQMTHAVLHTYYLRWIESGHDDSTVVGRNLLPRAEPTYRGNSMTPLEVAVALGFLIPGEKKDDGACEWTPVALDQALSCLDSSKLSSRIHNK